MAQYVMRVDAVEAALKVAREYEASPFEDQVEIGRSWRKFAEAIALKDDDAEGEG